MEGGGKVKTVRVKVERSKGLGFKRAERVRKELEEG